MAAVTRRQYKGAAAQTTITNALSTSDTSATLAATTGWPSTASVPFYVVISPGTASEEKCRATISGSVLTLTRAQDDTSAQTHASGATIYPVFTADDADEANLFASTMTARGDLLTMNSSVDPTRLALGSANTVLTSNGSDPSWGTVTSAMIADGTIVNGDISSSAGVDAAKLANFATSVQTGNYTLVAGDRNTREIANSASAITFTVNNSVFAAGDIVEIHNIGAGTLTIAAGSGVTINSADVLTVSQWQGGTLYFTSASAAIWFPRAKTVSAGGLTLIKTQTIGSAVTSVAVTGVFSSTYDNYKITINGGVASAGVYLQLQFGSTTTGYYTSQLTQTYGGSSSSAAQSNASAGRAGLGGTNSLYANIDVFAPNLAKVTQFTGNGIPAADTADQVYWIAGFQNSTTQFTDFTLIPNTGNITGGTIRVYGYANS